MVSIAMLATLLPYKCHARLHEIEKNTVLQGDTLQGGDGYAQIELQIISSENDSNNNVLGEESMVINSIGDAMDNNKNHFFHEDFLYSFEPLEDGASVATDTDHDVSVTSQKWKVKRIPKNTKTKRRMQEELTNQEQAIIANENDIGPVVQPTNANEQQNNDDSKKTTMFYATNILLSLACVIMAALAAGLTMGMLSLDVSIYNMIY